MGERLRGALFWLLAALATGALAGGLGVVLAACVCAAERLVAAFPALTWALPLTGLACVALYRALRVPWGASTGTIIACARLGGRVPLALAPAILAGTCLTVAGGGSVGKEAAALQLGGSVGCALSRAFGRLAAFRRLDAARDEGAFVRLGMAAAFGALFSAPVAATLFVLEVTRTHPTPASVLPPALAACVGAAAALLFPEGFLWRPLVPHEPVSHRLLASLAVACACAACAVAFCTVLGWARGRRWGRAGGVLDSPWAHALVGGAAVVLLAHAAGIQGFAGTGDALIRSAYAGHAEPLDFACKALLTLMTLGVGLKGGEIMPVMAVGASLGCVLGPLAGAEAGPAAALGSMCMFAACTNCPLASVALGLEAFGPSMAPTLVPGVLVAYALSAPVGLYEPNAPGGYRALARRCRAGVKRLFGR